MELGGERRDRKGRDAGERLRTKEERKTRRQRIAHLND